MVRRGCRAGSGGPDWSGAGSADAGSADDNGEWSSQKRRQSGEGSMEA